MLGFLSGVYDVLRINDLERIDRAIQENLERGNKYFALAIYDDKLCEELDLSTPIKNAEDRLKIAECLSGVDFAFIVSSRNSTEINEKAAEALTKYVSDLKQKEINKSNQGKKEFELVYTPGTYDLFHAGHLENLLEASKRSEKLIAGVKSDELVEAHKGRPPVITAQERMEILRHFKFVDGVYQYHTRDPHVAATWIKSKYGKDVDAIFMGSDLKDDFKDIKDINIVFTDRDPNAMKTKSTTAYRQKLTLLRPTVLETPIRYTGNSVLPIEKEIENVNVNKDGEER